MTLIRDIETGRYLHYIYEEYQRKYIWLKDIDKNNIVDAGKKIEDKDKFVETIEERDCELVTLLDADKYKYNAVRELQKDEEYSREQRELYMRTQWRTLI